MKTWKRHDSRKTYLISSLGVEVDEGRQNEDVVLIARRPSFIANDHPKHVGQVGLVRIGHHPQRIQIVLVVLGHKLAQAMHHMLDDVFVA